MKMRCCLPDCLNDTKNGTECDGITFHRFPNELRLRNLWKEALGIVDWEPEECSLLCSEHFQQDAFYETKSGVRRVRRGAVPVSDIEIFSTLQMEQVKQEPKEEGVLLDDKNIKIKQELLDKDEIAESSKISATVQPNDNININLQIKGEMEYMLQVTQIKQELPIEYVTVDSSEPIPNVTEVHDVSGYLMEMQENDSKQSLVTSECKEVQPDEANFGSSTEYESGPKVSTEKVLGGKHLTCKFCDYRCRLKSSLLKHNIKNHTGKEKFSCQQCGYRCVHKSDIIRHLNIHTGEKPFACQICDYKCRYKISLSEHMMSHTGEKPFACQICDYRCKRKQKLSAHMTSHTGEKSFACQICDYKCRQKISLSEHMMSHTGEKPFACRICDFKCKRKESLTAHVMSHTGEKPFACQICDYRCIENKTLSRHMKTHAVEKLFACQNCEKRFIDKTALSRHMKTHIGKTPFACQICDYKCYKKRTLAVHVRSHAETKPIK